MIFFNSFFQKIIELQSNVNYIQEIGFINDNSIILYIARIFIIIIVRFSLCM